MISNVMHLLILVKMVQNIQQFRKEPSQCKCQIHLLRLLSCQIIKLSIIKNALTLLTHLQLSYNYIHKGDYLDVQAQILVVTQVSLQRVVDSSAVGTQMTVNQLIKGEGGGDCYIEN